MGLTQEFVRNLGDITYDHLTSDVVKRVKIAFLDFLGLAARGSQCESTWIIRRWAKQALGQGAAAVIGVPEQMPYEYAALLNGAAAHALELDDIHNGASLHPGVVIFPTALAAASVYPCDGQTFIGAVVAGYETMVRLGEALQAREHYARGFHPTSTCGVFGAAVTAAKIMDLPGNGLVAALGIAGSQTAGSHEYHAGGGTWTKRFHPGWAAHSGLIAAGLAGAGFRAPKTILEGRDGFLHAYSGQPLPERILAKPGEPYAILLTGMKPHACCRYNQGGIDGILALVNEHDLRPENIKNIDIGMVGPAISIVAEPAAIKQHPQTVADAQFSMPYGATVAAIYRRASLSEYTDEVLNEPRVQDFMQRVHCYHDKALDSSYPRLWPTKVRIGCLDGSKFEIQIDSPKGDPDNPLTETDVETKFNDIAGPIWNEDMRQAILSFVHSLEAVEDLKSCQHLLQARKG